MIHLYSVTKGVHAKGKPPKLMFRPTTIPLPTDRRVAILGGRAQGKTLLLRMLAGLEKPDMGEIIVPLSLSPIANSRLLFHPIFTVDEGIRAIARLSGIDADWLAAGVTHLIGEGAGLLKKPVSVLNGLQRQELEIATLSILPFDCYLMDDAHQVSTALLERYLDAAARRGAGTIFTTVLGRQARLYADYVVVVDDCTIRAYNQVEEAVESYERKAIERKTG
jgi:ABC-type polysaccharide/polyol phosphate transport system ATPase subunit